MGSSNTNTEGLNDDSATVSDDSATKTDSRSDSDTETESDEECPPSPGSRPFEEGEKVLAFHNLHIYEAKVIKIEYRLKEWRYFVHYRGWNKNWDEWVGVERLMKFNEENVQKQYALNRRREKEKYTRAARPAQIKPKCSGGIHTYQLVRGKKRKNDSFNEEKCPSDKLISLHIPPTLKKQLVDDCEFINHLGKLVKLPRTPNVSDILKKYCDYRRKKDGLISESVAEILDGLQCYFDKAFWAVLLYKTERQQFLDERRQFMLAVTEGSGSFYPSNIYGAEHLLRLFVKLPEILASANLEEDVLMELQQKLVDFLKFLQKNQSEFFLSTYHVLEDTETSTNKQDD